MNSESKIKAGDKFDNLKANFFLQKTFALLEMNKFLKIIKYNKKIQERLNLSIKNYKDYGQIKIEIIPLLKMLLVNLFI